MQSTQSSLRITPYGIKTCCVCDAPTTFLGRDDDNGELMPYCAECVAATKAAFPSFQVFSYDARRDAQ